MPALIILPLLLALESYSALQLQKEEGLFSALHHVKKLLGVHHVKKLHGVL